MKKLLLPLILISNLLAIESCIYKKEITTLPAKTVSLDTVQVDSEKPHIYNPSEKREHDLLHTKLEVSFDWDSTYLYGKANLSFTPYFYATNTLKLDAKGFQIHEVAMIDSIGKKTPLSYTYDSLKLTINLGKTYHRTDTYEVFIDYTAMPNKLDEGGSAAITSDKGLYFINPDGSEENKPKQIWTQGEPESNSCWFPTIDAPNERSSQEIYMTVDSSYKTLSNGVLMFQTENGDGTRTDYWKQDLAHAPYLFMMAVGDFAEVKDEWRGMPVHYFVEPKYKAVAKDIYPNTVEMLEFFSTVLDYDYPWDKFHQIVVRDYVSGAMENTGAVVFGDFIQGDKRFLIDNSGEEIVAHELIHHWFGDLVTCESWANLPLNEAFATYGEYLWFEHKYGRDRADYHGYNDMRVYFQTAQIAKKNMIRFDYKNQMEMFDANTYQKGGRVLHMLRTYVGDEAFYASLNYYLRENEFTAVEIHDLRLAFEKITGEDLNWFFNQWFLSAGHPVLKVEKNYVDSTKTLNITVEQTQDSEKVPAIFKLPTSIEIIKANGEKVLEEVVLDERKKSFSFNYDEAPLLVNLDADKSLLAEINQEFNIEEAAVLYRQGGNYLDRYTAINLIKNEKDSLSNVLVNEALSDPFWDIRRTAIEGIKSLRASKAAATFKKLTAMALQDPKSDVRAMAIKALSEYYNTETKASTFRKATTDSSYLVVAASIKALYKRNEQEALALIKDFEDLESDEVQLNIASIYAEDGSAEHLSFFQSKLKKMNSFAAYMMNQKFDDFLEKQDLAVIEKALPTLKTAAQGEAIWWLRLGAVLSITHLNDRYEKAMNAEEEKMNKEQPEAIPEHVKAAYTKYKAMHEKIQKILINIRDVESNSKLVSVLDKAIEQ